jgi:glutamyl-tRNA synthetase
MPESHGAEGVRFAPSPTGPFHLGNFRTAWVSHEWARQLRTPWVVRFEDIDGPRSIPGARERQQAEMERLGLRADRVVIQSQAVERHWELFARAAREGRVYPCYCSRKEVRVAIDGAGSAPHSAPAIYNGRCRALKAAPRHALPTLGWRWKGQDESGAGDFVVARSGPDAKPGAPPARAGYAPSYQWACAIDDLDGGFRLVVRAWDLADSIPYQRAIQRWVGGGRVVFPAVFHAALVVGEDGARLEKRTGGISLPELEARGLGGDALTALFRESYRTGFPAFEAGAIFGEERREIAWLGSRCSFERFVGE